ncbi:MAG: helix-turn-helix domain-containing protein [Bacteroidales bacterium]|nr:helix-turn-helix domain-containing protein [Bacteroidales bacterium]MCL2738730.1 helix-turn-helix domain-containing protein [Bacteroidales bacterium]
MAQIQNEEQHKAIMERIEELMKVVNNDTPVNSKEGVEFSLLVDLINEYEDERYPIEAPSLNEVLKLRMYERNITRKDISNMLGVSVSRISEYMTGKSEPTLPIARKMCRELDIDASIVLGVC